MTTALTQPPSAEAPHHVRRAAERIAAHPVRSAVLMMFGVGYALLVPAAMLGLPVEPFLLATVLLGQLLPAVIVAAATGGRAGVRELFSRVTRWRVSPGGYALALLALPLASIALAAAVSASTGGGDALGRLVRDPDPWIGYLSALTILPLVNLWGRRCGPGRSRTVSRTGGAR